MFANQVGAEVAVEGSVIEADETIERLRDLIIIRLEARGMTQKAIGRVLNIAQGTVSKRLAAMPPAVKEHYSRFGF